MSDFKVVDVPGHGQICATRALLNAVVDNIGKAIEVEAGPNPTGMRNRFRSMVDRDGLAKRIHTRIAGVRLIVWMDPPAKGDGRG